MPRSITRDAFCVLSLLIAAMMPAQVRALTIWNGAYQENYEPDEFDDILNGARDAYVLLDPFDEPELAAGQVMALHAFGNQVAAYISVGTGEDWRDDFARLRPALVTKAWGDWAGEYFISDTGALAMTVMKARIDLIAGWGFDWVEFDNMDWAEDDGNRAEYRFAVSEAQGRQYYQALCQYARSKGLKCMAKSTVEGAEAFDGVTYESYPDDIAWWDQAGALDFAARGKQVIIVHYAEDGCAGVFAAYRQSYGVSLAFLCEDNARQGYLRFQ